MNQVIHLHRVFQRQLLGDGLGKAADDQGAGVLLGHAAAHQVEDGLLADAPDLGLVADVHGITADVHGRDRVGAAAVIQHQGFAAHAGLAAPGVRQHHNGGAEVRYAAVAGNALGGNMARRVRRGVHDLGTGVQVLPGTGKRDAGELHAGTLALQNAHRVQAARVGAEGAGDPFNGAALFDPRTLGVQVVHVLGPVFNRGVAHARTLADENLHTACVQVGDVVLRGRAALDKVQVRALVHDDQGVLELARAGGVQAEVGLQGNVHMHTRGDVDEGTAAPHSAVQRRKLVVRGGHALHEVLLHHVGVGAGQGALHIGVDDALRGDLLLDVVVNDLGVVLCADARQARALGLRNAQTLKGVLDVVGHLAPLAAHLGVGAHVCDDIAHVQPFQGRAPVGNGRLVVNVQRLQAEFTHPLRIVLFLRNLFYDLCRQAGVDLKRRVDLVLDVVDTAVNLGDLGLFSLEGSHLASSSFSAVKPSSMISLTRLPSPVRTMRASSSTWT